MPNDVDFGEMANKWSSAVVSRTKIEKFSGGVLNPATLANIDSQGIGPPRYIYGKRVLYKVADVVAWLEARCKKAK